MPLKSQMNVRFLLVLCALMLCALVGAAPARADTVADFYKGRTVTIVVSSSAAGA